MEQAAPAPDHDFLAFQSALAGQYSLERELGRGGMGIVYLAREVRLAREVAIKLLPPALAGNPDMREQFFHEAQIAARLSHPHIVPIHRVDEVDDFVYFVMALVDGESLGERIRRRGALPPHEAARILREVAWALSYAHFGGICHRDVKADNILIEHRSGRALVTDFGLANVAHVSARTADGLVMGSAHYLSPEQAAGEPVDERSDLYSLGVVGYYALTGRLPFDGTGAREIMTRHLRDAVPPIGSVAPGVPHRLASAVERCLEKNPEERFQNAAAFAEALDLAIEPPREIPAPIRVWITRGQQSRGLRVFLAAYASMLAIPVALMGSPLLALAFPVGATALLVFGPSLIRTRHLLASGYSLGDMRAALHEYWLRRREELDYEEAEWSFGRRLVWGTFCVSAIAWIGSMWLLGNAWWSPTLILMRRVSGFVAFATFALGATSGIRAGISRWLGEQTVRFWSSKWGERLAAVAGIGLDRRAMPQHQLPQATEVALGRATDALYDALPRELKQRLRELPDTVKRLEAQAGLMRSRIESMDAELARADGPASANGMRLPARYNADSDARHENSRNAIVQARRIASDRLGATVAALENIRLDLLRLQMGSAPRESVTAALEAAVRVGTEIGFALSATDEAEAVLAQARRETEDLAPPAP